MAHTFNFSPRYSLAFNPRTRGNIKWEERERHRLFKLFSFGRGKSSLVSWLPCFSGFRVEYQVLSLGFTIHAKKFVLKYILI